MLVDQLRRRAGELERWLALELGAPAEVRLVRGADRSARLPDYDDRSAPLLVPGGDWREPINSTVWLRFRLHRPDDWPAHDTALLAQRFGTLPVEIGVPVRTGIDLQRMQGLLYIDGLAYHGLDQYHRRIFLPVGPEYQFAASVWTGFAEMEWQPNPVFRLARMDPDAVHLWDDLRILADALAALELTDPARAKLDHIAEAALLTIDWSSPGSPSFRMSLQRAHDNVRIALAQAHAADYEPGITAVGHAHIDCAWLWPIAQTREKAARTWSTALRLMERYPEYHFLASTPLQYEMVKEDHPQTFEEIRKRVREGRWEPVGGMWVEADCNLPDGESLVRQILIGTRYFEREFGVRTSVAWLPDTFGFTWALPTLLAAAGLRRFVTHKLSWSQTNRIPHDLFRWRGPDGSEVLAHFLCTPSLWIGEKTTYNGTLLPSIVRGAWQRFADRDLHDELLVAFGYGDGGGGPSIEMLEGGGRLANLPGFPRVTLGRADEFFSRAEHLLQGRADVPVWDGELYLEYHRGTYTGQARQKRRNALAQRLYHAAELYASIARVLLNTEYPRSILERGWRLILTNQFHDILPGSAISQVYVDAEADFERLGALGDQVLDDALGRLSEAITLRSDSVVVFNPSPFASDGYAELPVTLADLPAQRTADGTQLVFCPGVPPNGYQAFAIGEPRQSETSVSATPRGIDSPFWEIALDDGGHITHLWDKQHRQEAVAAGQVANRLVVFEDRPLNFDAWDIDAFHAAKSREAVLDRPITVLESGPERATLELDWKIGERTHIVQRMHAYAHLAPIDFVTRVEWHERQSLLKVAFPTRIRNRRATYEIQFGSIDRPTHRNTSWEEAAFEVPAQRWADLSDAHYGVAVLSDCKHGYSAQTDTLWLSLLKGAVDPDPAADIGEHQFTYSVLPHAAGLDAVRRAAYGLTRPLLWRRAGPHGGTLPTEYSLAATDAASLIVETAKWAEDENALILRLYEADGGATRGTLHLPMLEAIVDEVDLLERNPRRVDPGALTFRAREVKTVRVVAGPPA